MRAVAIVGHEAAKFRPATEADARHIIRKLLVEADVLVSGGCHLGGVDTWAEEEARRLDVPAAIHLPKRRSWEGGYKERNLLIAKDCTEAHCIVVREYPPDFAGERHGARPDGSPYCYHCDSTDHVKSGGCWTVIRAGRMGKPTRWHIV